MSTARRTMGDFMMFACMKRYVCKGRKPDDRIPPQRIAGVGWLLGEGASASAPSDRWLWLGRYFPWGHPWHSRLPCWRSLGPRRPRSPLGITAEPPVHSHPVIRRRRRLIDRAAALGGKGHRSHA